MAEKVISNLESLTLKDKMMLSHGHFPDNLLQKLKFLKLCFGDSYEGGATLPFKFFEKVPNLEALMIRNFNALHVMFPSQCPKDIDHIINILAQARRLVLESLPLLSSIGFDNSWVEPVRKNLRVLKISDCPHLNILVSSSTVSFCNLKKLKIRRCHGLVSLFSSSVAKSLVQLHKMEVIECRSITHIVCHEKEESASDEIIFERLEFITLSHLPSLMSFYSGNATLEFSALLTPTIENCPKMKCFSQGVIRAPNFVAIYTSTNDYVWLNCNDLNTTVQKLFNEKLVLLTGVQYLKLGDYPELGDIWHGAMKVPNGGFNKLKTLIVDGCQFLSNYVIPFHLVGFLSKLEHLRVRNCDSVKAIFEVGSLSSPFYIPLKSLSLQQLPALENIWNEDPQEFLNFQSLQHVDVDSCKSLKSLFTASMSQRKLESLEFLKVRSCEGLVEIIANDETILRGTASNSIMFPNLTTLHLQNLAQLKCIFPKLGDLEWPKLKVFHVCHCDRLRIFPKQGHDRVPFDVEAIVSFEKGVPNLEQLSLNKADFLSIDWRGRCEANFIKRVKFLILQCFHEDSDRFPYELFQKGSLPNLEKLRVGCSKFKEIFSSQKPNADVNNDMLFAHLKGLELFSLPRLESIGLEQSLVAPILDNLEFLGVQYCHRLWNLVPSYVSFSKLRELHVYDCDRLAYLFPLATTARRLVLLEKLSIVRCASIEEIVSEDEDGFDEDDITFDKLKTLSLVSLQSLRCFCSGDSTLNFPCLELVTVHECPEMRVFSYGAINAVENLKISTAPTKCTNFPLQHCGSDLNASIKLLFTSQLAQYTRGVQYLWLEYHPELEEIWHGAMTVPDGGFRKLKTLIVDDCPFLSHYVIPCHLLGLLNNLEDLQVRNCDFIKAIFEVGSLSTTLSFSLKSMTLEELSNLEQVWSEDPQEILNFQSLQHVYVQECRSLKRLFPASISQGKLGSLEILEVGCCEGLFEIVASEEIASTEEATRNLVIFPSLIELKLRVLPELKCIYSGLNNVEWPKLKKLDVYHCDQLTIFPSKGRGHVPIDVEVIVSFEKDFPNLEKLSLSKAEIMNISWQGKCEANFIHQRVKFLVLQCFHEDSVEFPVCELFQKTSLPNLEKLQVACSTFKEIFSSQRPDLDPDNDILFPHLKGLELTRLRYLESIGLKQLWVAPILENLETLEVEHCPCLRNLVPSVVSFSKLRELHVDYCDGLVSLFTLSTARSLVLLEELFIESCASVQEIVSKEGDGSDEDDITFSKLKTLTLVSLPRLGCFYSGDYTLNFPCLEHFTFQECPKMRIFSKRLQVSTRVILSTCFNFQPNDEFTSDLNASIKSFFASQLAQYIRGVQHLGLEYHLELEDIWHGVMPVPNGGFSKLKTLTVAGCKFLSHYVIPCHLLGFLSNLEDLRVQDCDSIKAIFGLGPLSTPLSFQLKRMTLEELPNLEQVWNEDPQEILSFQALQHVHVHGCKKLKSLFSASMTQCKLESLKILKVEYCEGLVEIIASEESASDETTGSLVIFPSLTQLRLRELPELRCLYSGLNNVEWPMLKELDVHQCGQLKNIGVVGLDHFAIIMEATVTLEKVFPNLELVSLYKEDIMQIWQAPFPAKLLQRAKFIKLEGFCDDSDVFPYGFFGKESLSHVEKIAVSRSNFKQMFTSERSDLDGIADKFFSQLKTLELISLSKLNSIGFEHTPLPENLEILEVTRCPFLINLAPSTVSFSNLRDLDVSDCDGLIYLFTSSTAKSLASLEMLSVCDCGSMQEIVAKEDESDQDEITFGNLKTLVLYSLPSIDGFYTGMCDLKFPCLEEVEISCCFQMKVFSHADIYAPDNVTIDSDDDLRGMIEKAFKRAT